MAEKYHRKHLNQVMDELSKEMGMTTVVLTCYTRLDGKFVIDT